MREPLGLVVVVLAVLGALATAPSTEASWTGSATIPGTAVKTGDLDIRIEGLDSIAPAELSRTGLEPGSLLSKVLTVSNAGTTPFDYYAGTVGTNPDGNDLFGALNVTWRTATDGACGAPLASGARELEPDESEEVCLQVSLPAGADRDVAGSATQLTFNAAAGFSGWTDNVPIVAALSTVAIQAPTLSCTVLGVPMGVNPVPGATSYLLHGVLGGVVEVTLDQLGSLGDVIMGLGGLLSAQAVFGSEAWVSDPGTTCA